MKRAWLLALSAALAACPPAESPSPSAPEGPEAAVRAEGRALYAEYCALCHGPNLEGYAADHANALKNQSFLRTADDAFLWTAIARGRPGTAMAGYHERYGGPLTDEQMSTLVAFLRSHQTEPPVDTAAITVEGDPEAGAAIYEKNCVGCHGPEGEGHTAISLNNPLFLSSADDGYIRYAIEHGRPGTAMPAFGPRLSAQQIDDVTRYIRSLARTVEASVEGEVPPTFDQVVIHPDGPAPQLSPLREGRYVPVDEVKAALDAGARMVLLDARSTGDWLQAHIPGAIPVPYYDPDRMIEALPKDGTWIISYCACPHAASGRVMDSLREQGFSRTAVLDEGILEWMSRGYPVVHGAKE